MSEASDIFMDEFLAKHLVNYDECNLHYSRLSIQQLMDELKFFSSDTVKAIPFEYSGARHHAFIDVVINCAANYRGLSDRHRSLLVSTLILPFIDYALERTVPKNREQLKTAIDSTCYKISKSGLFPEVGELILHHRADYDDPIASPLQDKASNE